MAEIADLHERAVGVPVSNVLSCDGGYIVLLDYYAASRACQWANLRRLSPTGEVVWAANAPGSSDIFVSVDWREGRLVAWTWEGCMIVVDPETGQAIEKVFTK